MNVMKNFIEKPFYFALTPRLKYMFALLSMKDVEPISIH